MFVRPDSQLPLHYFCRTPNTWAKCAAFSKYSSAVSRCQHIRCGDSIPRDEELVPTPSRRVRYRPETVENIYSAICLHIITKLERGAELSALAG
ncbi:hypothetical protein RP20_CCG013817 [Aedes albopictus]|nr:hypothetical protein RP20_CCG013817 [Aedes albopictus]